MQGSKKGCSSSKIKPMEKRAEIKVYKILVKSG